MRLSFMQIWLIVIHFLSLLTLVIPEYFLASFFDNRFLSLQPIPPSQCPALSIPFNSSFLHLTQSDEIDC